ncbi:SH3 and cysteine-rich domain-containing protein 2-like isoform X1 [Phycodurus eques]|uniref:SH3 and cysteine-rich domain-containing protein 2-like isoform X1 n=1 Tax=Phycodurus eques TaxID=693459 RepID=UPI002ACDD086|nr:SH3 and cysteine-rich domain-containing protein 2-like isoform X1 [Phycodurus eques]
MTEINEMASDSQFQLTSQPLPSKLQRLKRSLSFMRSKSVENFFQRSDSDARLPPEFITEPAPPSPPPLELVPAGSPVAGSQLSPSLSPSVSPNPSVASHSPSLRLSPSLPPKPPHITHCFHNHVFRKPTNCQLCKHMILGNSKQALRCKTCKLAAHLWCTSELSQQPCHGKSGAFKRNFSSPMLVSEQLAVVKEVQTNQEAVRARTDPVYAALRYGTSLAQMSRSSFGSMSESPTHSPGEACEERQGRQCSMEEDVPQETGDSVAADNEVENEEDDESGGQAETPAEVCVRACVRACTCVRVSRCGSCVQVPPKRIEVHPIHTYVALYSFLPQEHNDLELHPGDRVQVTDDSNEEWWKGKSGDRVGFFPANFVQRVRPGERVWRVIQGTTAGSRERGHMVVKEAQICVGKREDGDTLVKLSSGKKRGLVPAHSIEEI